MKYIKDPNKSSLKRKGSKKTFRPWTLKEVPVGAVVEYKQKSWRSSDVTHNRAIIVQASEFNGKVEIRFGAETLTASKMLSGDYAIIKDGKRFPCGFCSEISESMSSSEKAKACSIFAELIGAGDFFFNEFIHNRLDADEWLDSAKEHKVLVGDDGNPRHIWHSDEPDPDLSIREMCESRCVVSAYDYVLGKMGISTELPEDFNTGATLCSHDPEFFDEWEKI